MTGTAVRRRRSALAIAVLVAACTRTSPDQPARATGTIVSMVNIIGYTLIWTIFRIIQAPKSWSTAVMTSILLPSFVVNRGDT